MIGSDPKVSVIVAAYNVEKYIDRCLKSLLKQTYKNIEIIVINDGSTDRTSEYIKKYHERDIKVITKKNGGLSSVRNMGLKYCSGEYIAQFDGDDYVDADWVESCMQVAHNAKTDVIFFGIDSVNDSGEKLKYGIQKDYKSLSYYTGEEIIEKLSRDELKNYSVGFMARKKILDILKKPVFPEKVAFEDLASTYKIMMVAEHVVMIPGIYYHYVQHKSSITHSPSFKQYEDLKKIEVWLISDLKNKLDQTIIVNWEFHIEMMQYQILSYYPVKNNTVLARIRKNILSLYVEQLRPTEKIKKILLKLDIYKYVYPKLTKIRLL